MLLLQAGASGLMIQILPFLLIFVVFYFFILRPQSKRMQEQQAFTNNLKKGDKVVTTGGIHGRVQQIDEQTLVLQVDVSTKIRVEKSALSAELSKATAAKDDSITPAAS